MKHIVILIFLNLLFSSSFCMEQDNLNNNLKTEIIITQNFRTVENQETFETFFTNQDLKKQARQVLSSSNAQDKIGDLFIIPVDILKEIIFSYLININSTDEQEIYKNFKNLALTCKQFAKLGKIIMGQIVLISEKQMNPELEENLNLIRNEIHEFRSIYSEKKISTINAPQNFVSIAAEKNKACWLTFNYDKITRRDSMHCYQIDIFEIRNNQMMIIDANSLDQVEHALILAAKNNNLSSARILLKWIQENKEPVSNAAIERLRALYDGNTPLHIAIHNRNLNLIKLLLENNADTNIKNFDKETPLLVAAIYLLSPIMLSDKCYQVRPIFQKDQTAILIIKILIKHGAKNLSSKKELTPKFALKIYYKRCPDEEIKNLIDEIQNSKCEIM